ncbi:hypothetical protein ACU8OR_33895 (plasmid) [Rhizobium leguminosarum]
MIYSEEKSGGLAVPLIGILLAIAGIFAVLVATGGRHSSAAGRVWVPQASIKDNKMCEKFGKEQCATINSLGGKKYSKGAGTFTVERRLF